MKVQIYILFNALVWLVCPSGWGTGHTCITQSRIEFSPFFSSLPREGGGEGSTPLNKLTFWVSNTLKGMVFAPGPGCSKPD